MIKKDLIDINVRIARWGLLFCCIIIIVIFFLGMTIQAQLKSYTSGLDILWETWINTAFVMVSNIIVFWFAWLLRDKIIPSRNSGIDPDEVDTAETCERMIGIWTNKKQAIENKENDKKKIEKETVKRIEHLEKTLKSFIGSKGNYGKNEKKLFDKEVK